MVKTAILSTVSRFLPSILIACLFGVPVSASAEQAPGIQIDEQPGPNPWSHLRFPDAGTEFQFAVIGDNTGGAYPGVFDRAMRKLNLVQPEFVLSVGDLIEGYSNDREALITEWDGIDASVGRLDMPFFYVVGNHDIGDAASADVWRERLGRTYYHFVYKDVLFLCMDTEDPWQQRPDWTVQGIAEMMRLRQTDPEKALALQRDLLARVKEGFITGEEYVPAFGDEQINYFKEVIATHSDVKWTFVVVHRPVWQANPVDKKFIEIEAALSGRPYTVFAGHAHTYEYQQREGMDYIRLSTTGGAWVLDPPGNFDHITWVTMTDEGPVLANITLDGIFEKTGERVPVRESLQ